MYMCGCVCVGGGGGQANNHYATYYKTYTLDFLCDASGIYGVVMASSIDEDCFGIEDVREAISAAVRIRSARMASTSNYAICP